jgi:UDP-N-acetylglucosamine transferase subunit ALG13
MFPFDRLVRTVDEWSGSRRATEVLVQIGSGEYVPRSARWIRSLSPNEFHAVVEGCDVLVAHVGMGSLLAGMQARKPMLLLPRIRALGEHTTDHQVHTAKWVKGRRGIWIADDETQLARLLDDFLAGRIGDLPEDVPKHASPELIRNVRRFLVSAT